MCSARLTKSPRFIHLNTTTLPFQLIIPWYELNPLS